VDPISTIPYPEFCVAQRLAKLLPAKLGYSLFVPASRQQRGVDLILAKRGRSGTKVATIQVKASRTYMHTRSRAPRDGTFRYHTWFNTFECPPEADFFCLVALYPAVDSAQRRDMGAWWAPQVMLFTQAEMRRFLKSVRTVAGHPDKMFGFAFNDPTEAVQVRGDSKRQSKDFGRYLLDGRVSILRRFLASKD